MMSTRIEDLAFDHEVGVDGDHGFRAQSLRRAGRRLNNWWWVYRNDAWPDSDLGARYLAGEIPVQWEDPDEGYAEVAFIAVDADDTVRDVLRQIRHMSPAERRARSLGGYTLRGTLDEARRSQASTDASYAHTRAKAPWMVEHPYTGDYAHAIWARGIPENEPPFPASYADSTAGAGLPWLVDLRGHRTWLTEPAPPALAGSLSTDPRIPEAPVRLRATRMVIGEDSLAVSRAVRDGERALDLMFEVGARDDICGREEEA